MKAILYVIVILSTLLFPLKRNDVAKLCPVELLSVWKNNGKIVIQTESGDYGVGENLSNAIADLTDTAMGTIYLDTAEYLLLEKECEDLEYEIRKVLKNSVEIYTADGYVDPKKASEYLSRKNWKNGEETRKQTLREENERISSK